MITTFDKKVNALAARHGWRIDRRATDCLHMYEITPEDRNQRDAILRTVSRCKGLTAETFEPYCSSAWICVIHIYDTAELGAWRRLQSQYSELTDLFCQIIHDGGTQEQAKAAQLRRAHELDAMQAYFKLYA